MRYDTPGGDLARTTGRVAFLEALREHVPAVLDDLRTLLPAYRVIDRPLNLVRLLRSSDETLEALRADLVEWGMRFDLTDATGARNPWTLAVALDTLEHWNRYFADPVPLAWCLPSVGFGYPVSIAEQRIGEHEGPDLLFTNPRKRETEAELVADGIRREDLRAHVRTLEKLASERGYRPAPEVRDRDGRGLASRYRWLALYVAGKQTQEEIARRRYGQERRCEPPSVGEAIRKTAALIGLAGC